MSFKRSSSRLAGSASRAPRTSSSNPTAQSDENPPPVLTDVKNVLAPTTTTTTTNLQSTRKPLTLRNSVPQSTRQQISAPAPRQTKRIGARTRLSQSIGHPSSESAKKPAQSRRAAGLTKTAPLTRVGPPDSDEPEYVRVDAAQPRQSILPRSQGGKRASAGPMSPSVSSHGSSDKENVPPPSHFRVATSHARPIVSTSRPCDILQEVHLSSLDNLFPISSDGSDSLGSPGVGRRASALDQRMQEYQDMGVSKVRAWKAAKHDQAAAPDTSDIITAIYTEDLDNLGDDDDFGFMDAERRIKLRQSRLHARHDSSVADSIDSFEESALNSSAPVYPSEDAILAAHAFNMSSSPTNIDTEHIDTSSTARVTRSRAKKRSSSSAQPLTQQSAGSPIPVKAPRTSRRRKGKARQLASTSSPARSMSPNTTFTQPKKLRMDDALSFLPRRKPPPPAKPSSRKSKTQSRAARTPQNSISVAPLNTKGKARAPPSSSPVTTTSASAATDSDKTKRIKQFKAAEKYTLETEYVI